MSNIVGTLRTPIGGLEGPTLIRAGLMGLMSLLVAGGLWTIAIVLTGNFGEDEAKVVGTFAALVLFSVTALPSILHLEAGRYREFSGLGILASLAFFAMAVVLIWSEPEGDGFFKPLATLGVTAFLAGHASLMLSAMARGRLISAVLIATVLVTTAVAAVSITAIWTEDISGTLLRALGTLVVLDILGTIAVPVLSTIRRTAAMAP